jgi:hypothetical protein
LSQPLFYPGLGGHILSNNHPVADQTHHRNNFGLVGGFPKIHADQQINLVFFIKT